ncbi:MAG: hypothetical protein Q7V10_02530 [Methanobacteriaceae archaeon]|nr:hypothetical protein [Methanobacteriaceae archaeon]MDO9626085.1 hypothetical protein [Methanobacteriaceae archaeon]
MQPAAATTQDKIKTMIIIDHEYYTHNFGISWWLATETYLIDVNKGSHLNHQVLRYELYNPEGVLCEVQKHKTDELWYEDDVCAEALFEGDFPGEYWALKVFYDGNDIYEPCQKTFRFSTS